MNLAKGSWVRTLDQEMDMVGHEAIGVEGVTELAPVAAQPFEIRTW
jgi:hypothetical protein